MTPKEKAQALYNKAENYIYTSNAHNAEDNCEKNCALLAVDEVLTMLYEEYLLDGNRQDRLINYWNDVRRELYFL